MSYDCIQQLHIVAQKNKPVYINAPAHLGVAKAELIGKDGTVLKSLYSHLAPANLPAGLVLFQDTAAQAGKIFLGSSAVSIATASGVDAPSWVGVIDAADKVIKVAISADAKKMVSVGELLELRFNNSTPTIIGRISVVGADFVEISRSQTTSMDMTKLITSANTPASVYLLIKDGRFGQPIMNPIYQLKIVSKDTATINLPTTYHMINPMDEAVTEIGLTFPAYMRDDIVQLGTNNYGHQNVLFDVLSVDSDTQITVKLPSGFSLSGAASAISDSSKAQYIILARVGIKGATPAHSGSVAESATNDMIKVDAVAAGATELDSCLLIVYFGLKVLGRINNV